MNLVDNDMKIEQVKIGVNHDIDTYTIKADEGKVLRRKGDEGISGVEITLGYVWYLNGEKLDEPHWETPDEYEEIDMPDEYKELYNIE